MDYNDDGSQKDVQYYAADTFNQQHFGYPITDVTAAHSALHIQYFEYNVQGSQFFYLMNNVDLAEKSERGRYFRAYLNAYQSVDMRTKWDACGLLGEISLFGLGVERNEEQAVKYLEQAAMQTGNVALQAASLYRLGEIYFKGWGKIKVNYPKAWICFVKAGDDAQIFNLEAQAASQYRLGEMCLLGLRENNVIMNFPLAKEYSGIRIFFAFAVLYILNTKLAEKARIKLAEIDELIRVERQQQPIVGKIVPVSSVTVASSLASDSSTTSSHSHGRKKVRLK